MEEVVLMEAVREKHNIIEGRFSFGLTKADKHNAWLAIASALNRQVIDLTTMSDKNSGRTRKWE